jgi:cellulose synthase/poly-beta-1,6-N-acetylglucosamine synthase-like glycosyltransferase
MNFLLSKSSKESEYIVFLEGDDLLLPDYLTKKLKIFTEYPKVVLVYNNLDIINQKNEIIKPNLL